MRLQRCLLHGFLLEHTLRAEDDARRYLGELRTKGYDNLLALKLRVRAVEDLLELGVDKVRRSWREGVCMCMPCGRLPPLFLRPRLTCTPPQNTIQWCWPRPPPISPSPPHAPQQMVHALKLFSALQDLDPTTALPPLYHLLHHFLYALFEFSSLEVRRGRMLVTDIGARVCMYARVCACVPPSLLLPTLT